MKVKWYRLILFFFYNPSCFVLWSELIPVQFYVILIFFIRSELVRVDPSWSNPDWRSELIRSDFCTCLFKTRCKKRSSASAILSMEQILQPKNVLHVKQRCSFFFSFKSKLSWFRAGHFNNCLVSCVMFFTPERLLETSVLGLFLFAIIKII